MMPKFNELLFEYIKFIQTQIANNSKVIEYISDEIKRLQNTKINDHDPLAIEKNFEENYNSMKKVNAYVNQQEFLLRKLNKITSLISAEIKENEIPILQELLEHYTQVENYERCSIIRDKIIELQKASDIIDESSKDFYK